MSWFWLVLAITFEVLGTTSMKLSAGLTKLTPTIALFIFYGLSLVGLTLALKKMDVSVAYAVWSGLGTILITAVGVFWFRESLTPIRIGAIGMIIVGVVVLNLSAGAH